MPSASRLTALPALGVVAIFALSAPFAAASAAPSGPPPSHGDGDSLIDIGGNNVGPFQVCNNDVPVNVAGVQVPVSELAGVMGVDSDGNKMSVSEACDQVTEQNNGDESGSDSGDSLVKITDNNVGPFQVCNNNVPVNVGGVQVPVSELAGVIGLDSDGNETSVAKACDQATEQNNGDASGEDGGDSGDSLVKIDGNNVGPFQACNNNVPVDVLGVQVPVSELTGVMGIDNDGNEASVSEACDQATEQNNGDASGKQGGDSGDSLLEVADNNVGPFQACNNDVPVNVLGVQVPVSELAGVIGLDSDGNKTSVAKACDQVTEQNNGDDPDGGNTPDDGGDPDGDNPDGDNPDGDNPDGDNPDGDDPDNGGRPDTDDGDNGGDPDSSTDGDDPVNADSDPDESSVLPNTGGPALTLLVAGSLAMLGGGWMAMRNRRSAHSID